MGCPGPKGLVLRYLADAYKALRQTVPEDAKTEELIDLIEWLGELVRQVDSSLIDEWERLRNPAGEVSPRPPARPATVTSQHPRVPGSGPQRVVPPGRAGRARRTTTELGELGSDDGWDADAWADAVEPYFEVHDEIGTGAGRAAARRC